MNIKRWKNITATASFRELGFCTEFQKSPEKKESDMVIYLDTSRHIITRDICNRVQCAAKQQECKITLQTWKEKTTGEQCIAYILKGNHNQNYNMLSAILNAHGIS